MAILLHNAYAGAFFPFSFSGSFDLSLIGILWEFFVPVSPSRSKSNGSNGFERFSSGHCGWCGACGAGRCGGWSIEWFVKLPWSDAAAAAAGACQLASIKICSFLQFPLLTICSPHTKFFSPCLWLDLPSFPAVILRSPHSSPQLPGKYVFR